MSLWPSRQGAESALMRTDSEGLAHDQLPWAPATTPAAVSSSPRSSPYSVKHNPQRSLKRRASLTKAIPSSARFRSTDMSDSPHSYSPATPSSQRAATLRPHPRRSHGKTRPHDFSVAAGFGCPDTVEVSAISTPQRAHPSGSKRRSLSPTVMLVFPTIFPVTGASSSSVGFAKLGPLSKQRQQESMAQIDVVVRTPAFISSVSGGSCHTANPAPVPFGPPVPTSEQTPLVSATPSSSATVAPASTPPAALPAPAESDRFWGALIRFARAQLGPPFSSVFSGAGVGAGAAKGPSVPIPVPTVLLLAPHLLSRAEALSLRYLPLDASHAHACLSMPPRALAAANAAVAPATTPTSSVCPPPSWASRTAGLPICGAAVGIFAGVPSLILALCPLGCAAADLGTDEAVLAVGGAGAGTNAGTGAGVGQGMGLATMTSAPAAVSGGLFVWAIAHGPGLSCADIAAAKRAHSAVRTILTAAAGPQLQALAQQPDTAATVSALATAPLAQFLIADGADQGRFKIFRVTQNIGGSWVGPVVKQL